MFSNAPRLIVMLDKPAKFKADELTTKALIFEILPATPKVSVPVLVLVPLSSKYAAPKTLNGFGVTMSEVIVRFEPVMAAEIFVRCKFRGVVGPEPRIVLTVRTELFANARVPPVTLYSPDAGPVA